MSATVLKFPSGELLNPASVLDLPFVCDLPKGQQTRGNPRCFWNVTPTGDYAEDCHTGSLYALAYLQYRLAEIAEGGRCGLLPSIARDMRDSTGIEVGFLSIIDHAAEHGVHEVERMVADHEQWRAEDRAKEEKRAKRRKRTARPKGGAT